MSIFEVDLNKEFKFINSIVFLDNQEFAKYYILNNLHDDKFDKNEFACYMLDDYIIKVDSGALLSKRGLFDEQKDTIDSVSGLIKTNIYNAVCADAAVELYPEWQLFYIAIKKVKNLRIYEWYFLKHIESFRYIAEIRYKEYVIRNLQNFVAWQECAFMKDDLGDNLIGYIKDYRIETEALLDFLSFLSEFHRALRDEEKYKLMWNLEVYTRKAIEILIWLGHTVETIYAKVGGGTYSELHKAYIYKPLYIKESKGYLDSFLPLIGSLFGEVSKEDFDRALRLNPRYEDVLFTYIESNKIYNANKINEVVLGAMIKAIVLGVEEIIKEKLQCNKLYDNLKKIKSGSHLFDTFRGLIGENDSGGVFFDKFNTLISEKESLEKYLMTYYHFRNYLAHNNIDMEKFFRSENDFKKIIDSVISSVVVTLFCVAKSS